MTKKICLVGHLTRQPDEGVHKLAQLLAGELAQKHQVLTINFPNLFSWRRIPGFKPDIIHYVISPSQSGMVIAKWLSALSPGAKTVISAPHPASLPSVKWMGLFRPDLVLVQSELSEKMFEALGYRTQFLPNGVDISRFKPVNAEQKHRLRKKYAIAEDKFILLHVASLKRGRNLGILKTLQAMEQNQVLIIGRCGEHRDEELSRELAGAGCLVKTEYLPKIEEIYALADCYVFPTVDRRYCIETPLSVLEAMSCNLPVVTTPFGALPRIFGEGDGLSFTRQESGFVQNVESIRKGHIQTRTREKVMPLAWEKIMLSLDEIYGQLLD